MFVDTQEMPVTDTCTRSSKRFKVLHFTACPDGGIKRHILDIVNNIPSDEIESQGAFIDPARCAVLDKDPTDTYAEHFRNLGMRYFLLDFPRHLHARKDLRTLVDLIGILRRERPDVLHCHSSKAGIIGRIAGLFCPSVRVYYSPHSLYFVWQTGLRRKVFYGLEWLFAWACHGMVAVSPSEEADLVKYFGRRKVIRINNGIDPKKMKTARDDRASVLRELGLPDTASLVLSITRLERVKDVPTLLRGFAGVRSCEEAPAHLLIAGDGHLRASLEEEAKALGIAGRVHFLGWRSDIRRLTAASDCVALTSRAEGLPYALLEAAAIGRPIVATRVCGSADVVQDRNSGFLIEPGDVEALTISLNTVLFSPRLKHELGAAGREFIASSFTVDGMCKSYVDLYKSCPS